MKDEFNYDLWFDYIRLEEQANQVDTEKVREVYRRAVSHQPLILEKQHWRRYIYLWLYYAAFEEDTCKDAQAAQKVYEQALEIVPHDTAFTFSKLWIAFA